MLENLISIMIILFYGEQMIDKKELFIATLLHDVKNPLLAHISSISQLLSGSFGELSQPQKDILNVILESTYYLQHLLQNVLLTYKNDNGQIVLNKNYFNVCNLLETCISQFNVLFEEKNLNVVLINNLTEKFSMLWADESQIRRVIENILINQINYAFKNTIIKINLHEANNYVIFSFQNSSPEITSEIKEILFEKYKSWNLQDTNLSTGLGLYLSKQIIQAHHGNIYLNNNKTANEFVFEIPINNIEISKVIF